MTKRILTLVFAFICFSQVAFADDEASSSPKRISRDQLSPAQKEILERGPIDKKSYYLGAGLGTGLGLGIGHAVQGRYGEIGWVFTVTEALSSVAFGIGLGSCATSLNYNTNTNTVSCNNAGLLYAGLFALIGFHVWEIIDVWTAPPKINKKYRRVKKILGEPLDEDASIGLVPVASLNSKMTTAGGTSPGYGVGLAFRF